METIIILNQSIFVKRKLAIIWKVFSIVPGKH